MNYACSSSDAIYYENEERKGKESLMIVAYSHHRCHDFGGRALVTRMSFSPSSLSVLCKVQSVACLFKPDS